MCPTPASAERPLEAVPHAPRARWRRSLATQSPGREAEIVRRARRPRRGAAAPSSTAWALASLRSVTLHFAPGAARQALVGDAQASTRTARAESPRRIGSHGRGPWAAGARFGAETRPAAQRACRLRKAERRRRRFASTEVAIWVHARVNRQPSRRGAAATAPRAEQFLQWGAKAPTWKQRWRTPWGLDCRGRTPAARRE